MSSDNKSDVKSVTVLDSIEEEELEWKPPTLTAEELDPDGTLRLYLSVADESGWGGWDYVHRRTYRYAASYNSAEVWPHTYGFLFPFLKHFFVG